MKSVQLNEFWRLASRPEIIAWAVAQHEGRRSICPLGWKMRTSFAPPMVAVSIAPKRFTHGLIAASGEFVLSWPGEDQAEATYFCGTHSGRNTDKFAEMGFTTLPARHIQVPLIAECAAHIECRVRGRLETGDHTIFAAEVLGAWIAEPPRRLLCSIHPSSGAEILLQRGGYSFGVVR